MRGDLLWEVKTCREMSDANFKLNIRSANLLEAFFGLYRTARATAATVQPGVHLRGLRAAAGL